ncbi:hypothetical protein DVH24_013648, partial [Malus domestica]
TSEGISTIPRLLNGLHCPRVGFYSRLFFRKGEVHPLGPVWTSLVSIIVGNNTHKDQSVLLIYSARCSALGSHRTSITLQASRVYASGSIGMTSPINELQSSLWAKAQKI